MLAQSAIPPPDPLGLPAPAWLLQILYLLTLSIHIVFMNFVVGGSLLTVANRIAAIRGNQFFHLLNDRIGKAIPPAISLTITFGVAPLLFVQALYGHLFYTTNILLGHWWLAVVIALLAGFYMSYLHTRTGPLWWLLSIPTALLFVYIAVVFTANAQLLANPDRWLTMGDNDLLGAMNDRQFWPRLMHNLGGAMVISGIWVAWLGRASAKRFGMPFSHRAIRYGMGLTVVFVLVQAVVGGWYLLTLQINELVAIFDFSNLAAWLFVVALIAVAVLLMTAMMPLIDPRRGTLVLPTAAAGIVLIGMVTVRERLRTFQLEGHFQLSQWDVRAQWSPMLLFFGTLVVALAVLIWLKLAWNRAANSRGSEMNHEGD